VDGRLDSHWDLEGAGNIVRCAKREDREDRLAIDQVVENGADRAVAAWVVD